MTSCNVTQSLLYVCNDRMRVTPITYSACWCCWNRRSVQPGTGSTNVWIDIPMCQLHNYCAAPLKLIMKLQHNLCTC